MQTLTCTESGLLVKPSGLLDSVLISLSISPNLSVKLSTSSKSRSGLPSCSFCNCYNIFRLYFQSITLGKIWLVFPFQLVVILLETVSQYYTILNLNLLPLLDVRAIKEKKTKLSLRNNMAINTWNHHIISIGAVIYFL